MLFRSEGVRAFAGVISSDDNRGEVLASRPTQFISSNFDFKKVIMWYLIISFIVALFVAMSISNAKKHSFSKETYSQYSAIIGFKDISLIFCFVFPITMIPVYLWLVSMLNRLRNKVRICDYCEGKMHKLSEEEEDEFLSAAEQTEERINSIDYDEIGRASCRERVASAV